MPDQQAATFRRRNTRTSILYLVTCAAGSLFAISRNSSWLEFPIIWLCVCAAPLLFVFAYTRCLLAGAASRRGLTYRFIFHIVGAVSTGIFFLVFSPFWKNPLRNVGESSFVLLVPLAAVVVFLAAALSLLFRNKSALATPATALIWPYWLGLALTCEGRWYQDTAIHAVFYFLCFLTPIVFALAAGAISWSPSFAHATALLGILGIPSLYWNLRDNGMGNVWVMFNQPDNRFAVYPLFYIFGICFVALVTLATATAILCLITNLWPSGRAAVSDRVWPAAVMSLIVMIVWFCQSVMPYRIPGAVDYAGWPVLQILHIQKRGLQFREECVSVSGYRMTNDYWLRAVNFSGNNRRLLQYRFKELGATGQLSESIRERVIAMLTASNQRHASWESVKPVRNWNADNWYVIAEGSGLKSYTTANGSLPPRDLVDLFNDLEHLPHASETQSELKDVCLGFCYDPLSAMGYLYANHRCSNAGPGVVCR